jgi:hypothetical protein
MRCSPGFYSGQGSAQGHCTPLAIRKEDAMAKRRRRTDDPRPSFGRPFTLGGKKFWAVPNRQIPDWEGQGEAVTEAEMLGAAQRYQAYTMLGASREEAEEYALDWLEERIRIRRKLW